MVRTPKGTFPLTDFTGREQTYDDEKFVTTPVKKGNSLVSLNLSGQLSDDWGISIFKPFPTEAVVEIYRTLHKEASTGIQRISVKYLHAFYAQWALFCSETNSNLKE